MIAAYPIGFAVTKDWLAKTGLKFAEGPTDTGVIVSWNTESPANLTENNMTLAPGGISITSAAPSSSPPSLKKSSTPSPPTAPSCLVLRATTSTTTASSSTTSSRTSSTASRRF